jgi:hypothetical protein
MFDLFPQETQEAQARASSQIADRLETTPGDAFSAAYEANRRNDTVMASWTNLSDAAQDHLDMVQQKTGQRLANPYSLGANPLFFDVSKGLDQLAAVRKQADALAQQHADSSLAFPDSQTLYEKGIAKARKATQDQARLAQGMQDFGTGGAEMAAGLGAQFSDPLTAGLNIAAMTTIPEGGLLKSALMTGASMAAQQAVQEAATASYKVDVDPNYGLGQAAHNVVGAAVGGVGLDLAGRLIGKTAGAIWRNLTDKAPEVAATLPTAARDAGIVAERQEDITANNPFRTGATGAAAHSEAVQTIEGQILRGQDAALPASAQAELGARTGQVFPAEPKAPAPEAISIPGRSFVGNRAVDVKYELAEARDLITSHDANFNVNPDYPPELQPRNRGGVPAREQVYSIAQNLEPERLGPSVEANSGAPIVGPDNVVESGNGRAMAVRMAYSADDAAAYKAFLERSGFDTSGMKEPVLVARRVTQMDEGARADFTHAANGSASLRMSTAEQALSDARFLGHDVTQYYRGGDVLRVHNRDFARAFANKLPPGERGGMLTANGDLSAAGVQRIKAAMVARAYGDPGVVSRAFDHADSNIKSIASALVDSSGDWIKFREAVTRGEIPSSHDVTDDVMRAVKTIMRARDEGEPVGKLLAQGDFFHSDTSQLAARLFFKRTEDGDLKRFLSKAAMGENLSGFAREMTESAAKGTDMFGAAPVTAKEALTAVVSKSDAREAALARFATPEKDLLHAVDDPKVQEAMNADLERNIAQGKNRVPVTDAERNTTLGFADAELHKIDGDLALSKELNACNTPMSLTEAAE